MTKMKLKIPFSPPDMSEEEAKEVKEAILSGWITTGPRTKKLETQIEEFINSGSSSKVQGSSPETCNMKPETQHTVAESRPSFSSLSAYRQNG